MRTTVISLLLLLLAGAVQARVIETAISDAAFDTAPTGEVTSYVEFTVDAPGEDVLEAYVEVDVSCVASTAVGVGGFDGESILVDDQILLTPGAQVVRLDVTRSLKRARALARASADIAVGPVLAAGESGVTLRAFDATTRARLVVVTRPERERVAEKIQSRDVRPVQDTAPPRVFDVDAYPNPFNPQTILRLELPRTGPVLVEMIDVRGRRVRQLHSGVLREGVHEIIWDGKDDRGVGVSSGAYFYRIVANGETKLGKVALLK